MQSNRSDIAFTAQLVALGMAIVGGTAWTTITVLSQITTSF